MASTGLYSSAFHRVSRSSCAPNNANAFSIRNILNLSEDNSQQYAERFHDCLPRCPVLLYLRQLPHVSVWPMMHLYNVHSHCGGLVNRQQFRHAQPDHDQRSLRDKKIHLTGEYVTLNWKDIEGKSRVIPRLQQALVHVLFNLLNHLSVLNINCIKSLRRIV